jgi:hypothetical protein
MGLQTSEEVHDTIDSVAVRQPVEKKGMPINATELLQAIDGE